MEPLKWEIGWQKTYKPKQQTNTGITPKIETTFDRRWFFILNFTSPKNLVINPLTKYGENFLKLFERIALEPS